IFARDKVHSLQHAHCAQCDVLKIADWSADEVERGPGRKILPGSFRPGGLEGRVLHARSLSPPQVVRRHRKVSSCTRGTEESAVPTCAVLHPLLQLTQSNRCP